MVLAPRSPEKFVSDGHEISNLPHLKSYCKNEIVVLTDELLGGIRKLDFLVKLTK